MESERLVREAAPGDAGPIAHLSHIAGQGSARISTYDLMIGGRPGPTAERIYLIKRIVEARTISMLHYSNHYVATVEGRVSACAGAVDPPGASLLTFVAALKETGWTDEEISRMRSGLTTYSRVEPPITEDCWAIQNVATLEGYRRMGLASALVEQVLERGRQLGLRRARLAVHIGNDAALNLYKGLGFEVKNWRTDPEFEALFGCPGMWEMTRPL